MNDTVLHNAWRAFNAGNYAEAAKLCQDILRADQKHYQALYLFGFIHSRFGQFADAERLIGEAIRINPREPDAHYNRGVMLQVLGRNEEALASYDRAIRLDDRLAEAQNNRGVLLRGLRRHEEACECYRRAIGLRPINLLVDITNFLTFDQARPLHVFDAKKVKGDLVVRRAKKGETLLALEYLGCSITATDERERRSLQQPARELAAA